MKALSVRHPWAHFIIYGCPGGVGNPSVNREIKDVENRTWPTRYRGPILIHASIKPDRWALMNYHYPPEGLRYGGIIGRVNVIDCVQNHPSYWAEQGYGVWNWVLADPQSLPFTPCKGRLGLFDVTDEVLASGDYSDLPLFAAAK